MVHNKDFLTLCFLYLQAIVSFMCFLKWSSQNDSPYVRRKKYKRFLQHIGPGRGYVWGGGARERAIILPPIDRFTQHEKETRVWHENYGPLKPNVVLQIAKHIAPFLVGMFCNMCVFFFNFVLKYYFVLTHKRWEIKCNESNIINIKMVMFS